MKMLRQNNSGQALVELALIMPMLMIFVFGIVDYTRALYDQEVITNLAGEGSSMASRSADLTDSVAATWSDADIDMASKGCVIMTTVASPSSGSYKVTGQALSTTCNSPATSKIGCYPPPSSCGNAVIPPLVQTVVQSSTNPNVYITEVFFNFSPVTPVGSFLHVSNFLPSQLYAVAYY
jgi:Flp pilus assembly protein TadG